MEDALRVRKKGRNVSSIFGQSSMRRKSTRRRRRYKRGWWTRHWGVLRWRRSQGTTAFVSTMGLRIHRSQGKSQIKSTAQAHMYKTSSRWGHLKISVLGLSLSQYSIRARTYFRNPLSKGVQEEVSTHGRLSLGAIVPKFNFGDNCFLFLVFLNRRFHGFRCQLSSCDRHLLGRFSL